MNVGSVSIGGTHVILQVMATKVAVPLAFGYLAGFGFVVECFCFALCFRRGDAA